MSTEMTPIHVGREHGRYPGAVINLGERLTKKVHPAQTMRSSFGKLPLKQPPFLLNLLTKLLTYPGTCTFLPHF